MSGLRQPGLGPIIGHTTSTSCRLWIRAGDPGDQDHELSADRRTLGVIAVLKIGDQPVNGSLAYFRLHREFDRTGTFNLGVDVTLGKSPDNPDPAKRDTPFVLQPDQEYCVGLGTLTIDDPFGDDENVSDDTLLGRLPPLAQWMIDELRDEMPDEAKAIFRTFPASAAPADQLGFVVGSCRYPGLLWKIKLADRIFGPIADQLVDPQYGPPTRFVLMVGDQIYADTLNRAIPIGRADTDTEFQERYVTAFSSLNMRRLLRSVPNYMILDDHEIEDNWTQDRLHTEAKHRLFNLAIGAYMSYQWSHGPRTWGRRLHCQFECAGYPFFVLDTRTQRTRTQLSNAETDDDLSDNHLLGRPALHPDEPAQLDQLLAWLTMQQQTRGDVPKFIVSSSVFVPNDMSERWGNRPEPEDIRRLERSDSWPAYPGTRRAILDHIVKHRVQNVVFLSGDIHCSNLAQMSFSKDGAPLDLKAFSVTSSAFYWPFPFADGNPADYVHDSRAAGQEDSFPLSDGTVMDYKSWNFTQEDNYCRLSIDRVAATILVRVYDTDGKQVSVRTAGGAVRLLEDTLQLAAW